MKTEAAIKTILEQAAKAAIKSDLEKKQSIIDRYGKSISESEVIELLDDIDRSERQKQETIAPLTKSALEFATAGLDHYSNEQQLRGVFGNVTKGGRNYAIFFMEDEGELLLKGSDSFTVKIMDGRRMNNEKIIKQFRKQK